MTSISAAILSMICITIISLPETKDKVFSLIYIFCAWAVYVQSWVDQLINQSEQQKIKQSGHLAQNLSYGVWCSSLTPQFWAQYPALAPNSSFLLMQGGSSDSLCHWIHENHMEDLDWVTGSQFWLWPAIAVEGNWRFSQQSENALVNHSMLL